MPLTASAPDHYATPDRTATGRAWRWLAAAAIFGNIFLNYYANTRPFAGQTMGMVSAKYPTLLTPAGYAFSIWGLIFLSLAVYAVWQLLPGQQKLSLPDALAKPLTLASVATASWVVLFANEMILPSVGVMVLILGWQPAVGLSVTLTLGLIFVVVAIGLLMSRVFRDLVFPLVVAWALAWLWVARLREVPELGWAALVGATVSVVAGFVFSRMGGRKTPWQLRDEAAAAAEAEIAARNASRRFD